jgi:hypothetical protein
VRSARRRSGWAVAAVLLAAACTHHVDAARRTCRAAFPGRTVVAAYTTTARAIRERSAGPGLRPAASAWPGVADDAAAVWCYVGADGGDRTVAAAVRGQAPVVFATGSFKPSPDGPQIP